MEHSSAGSDEHSKSIAGIGFSQKEMQIIHELVIGESYKVIAARLSMSERNVQYHVKNVMSKVGCNSKSDLMAFFNTNGIFPDDKYQSYIEKISLRRKLYMLYAAAVIVIVLAVVAFLFNRENKSAVVMDIPRVHENFLERRELLAKITDILESQSGIKTVVIIGAGGTGKTSLAREILRSLKCAAKWEINAETAISIVMLD
jgi:DNA-binding CsgD family transcriptional regulator